MRQRWPKQGNCWRARSTRTPSYGSQVAWSPAWRVMDSGSYPTNAMIILPCSMGTLARIANGLASNLIDRAADVCLKEKRPLVLCTRETPLNRIHIRNMDLAASAGATIYPLIPTFYNRPDGLEEMAHQFACRVLAFIGLPQPDAYEWKG